MQYKPFDEATQFFIDTVAKVRPEQWDDPALGVWNVRDLVGHTSRALLTAMEYAERPADKREIASSAQYYHVALGVEGIDDRVAERGRVAGEQLGTDPVGFVNDAADRVRPVIDRMDADALIDFNGKGIRYGDYLPTRVLELTVH
ncbi:MAG: maleylpyruvate isomerase N-terminal domain-containing protein, partial [Dehalococcoidia bacterium]